MLRAQLFQPHVLPIHHVTCHWGLRPSQAHGTSSSRTLNVRLRFAAFSAHSSFTVMLTYQAMLAAVAALVMSSSVVQARPMHAGIDYHRYLQDREDVKVEMQAWKIKFNEIASANGFIPHSESRSADDEEEDHLQRFFLTKDHVQKMSLENPDATFSTDSPFSLMTDDEFTSYVTNSHVLRNTSSSSSNGRRLRNGHVHSWGRTSSTTSKKSSSGTTATSTSTTSTASSSSVANLQGTSGGSSTTTKVTTSTVNGVTTTTTTKTTTTSSGTTTETTVVTSGASDSTASGYDFSNINNWWPSSTTATPTATTATPTATTATPTTTTATTSASTASDSDSIDWTTSGCISAVQDQGNCGDCWAFSSVAAVEAAQCLASSSKTLSKYSEQQLVSCDTQNYGCGGGAPAYALDFIKENGLCTETAYPYTSGTSGSAGSCSTSCSTTSTGITGYADITDEDGLITALADRPVIVAVAAGNNAWKQYSSGILSSCDTSALDHAVLVVGYDATSFKIKNSWGTTWGESGYIRLSRGTGSTGTCGMYTDMYQPTI